MASGSRLDVCGICQEDLPEGELRYSEEARAKICEACRGEHLKVVSKKLNDIEKLIITNAYEKFLIEQLGFGDPNISEQPFQYEFVNDPDYFRYLISKDEVKNLDDLDVNFKMFVVVQAVYLRTILERRLKFFLADNKIYKEAIFGIQSDALCIFVDLYTQVVIARNLHTLDEALVVLEDMILNLQQIYNIRKDLIESYGFDSPKYFSGNIKSFLRFARLYAIDPNIDQIVNAVLEDQEIDEFVDQCVINVPEHKRNTFVRLSHTGEFDHLVAQVALPAGGFVAAPVANVVEDVNDAEEVLFNQVYRRAQEFDFEPYGVNKENFLQRLRDRKNYLKGEFVKIYNGNNLDDIMLSEVFSE